jgi:hypothetical protein
MNRLLRVLKRAWSETALRLGWFVPALDLVGYETLVEHIRKSGCCEISGDFIEVGAFLGGGTLKLAKLARSCGKRVWVVDIFDPGFDLTRNSAGTPMASVYHGYLGSGSQERVFRLVTKPVADTLEILKQDSRAVVLPPDLRFAFGFIDGNHDPEYVQSDFQLIWDRLAPGGLLGLHDYGGDLPEVTRTIDQLIDRFGSQIESTDLAPKQWLIFLQKKAAPVTGGPLTLDGDLVAVPSGGRAKGGIL